jgi:hypothetical protein
MTSPLRLADAVLEALEECREAKAWLDAGSRDNDWCQARYDKARLSLVRAIREAAKQPTEDET